ncbi:unnamed protein product [Linum trigynum]|uniref:Uncharacterized protein n=1 Tax=Linum trigynum TaxID=586398 RepID=A0AAV2G173_9ROSI
MLRIGKSQESTKQENESENRKHDTRFTWFTNTTCVSYVHGREREPVSLYRGDYRLQRSMRSIYSTSPCGSKPNPI